MLQVVLLQFGSSFSVRSVKFGINSTLHLACILNSKYGHAEFSYAFWLYLVLSSRLCYNAEVHLVGLLLRLHDRCQALRDV